MGKYDLSVKGVNLKIQDFLTKVVLVQVITFTVKG